MLQVVVLVVVCGMAVVLMGASPFISYMRYDDIRRNTYNGKKLGHFGLSRYQQVL